MAFTWSLRRRKSVGDSAQQQQQQHASVDSLDAKTVSEASVSPVAHAPLVTQPLTALSSSRLSAASASQRHRDSVAIALEDASGKDKTALVPVKDAVAAYFRHNWIAVIYSSVSLAIVVLLLYLSFFAAAMGDGAKPEFLSCRSWAFGDNCGLWGINCRPFETEWSPIRCRARCTLDQSSSLAVWGTDKYHANSRICRAAVHAGVMGSNGGCALMRYSGPAKSFHGSSAHGVTSQSYASWFPKTFEFKAAPSHYCTDLTWPILAVSALLCAGFALLPRTNAHMLFATLVAWGFFYVRLVGQPPSVNYTGIAVDSFADIFVLLAATYWLYLVAPTHTFSQWSTFALRQRLRFWSLCYVVPFFVLINMNMFEYVPWLSFDLGGYEKSHANAGTYIVIALLVLFMAYCAYRFLRELYRGNLWRPLALWYAVVATAVLVSWALFSSTDFHLHHTMLGALFLPLTRFPTPLAAVAQSALLGAFVQGYAAWGWSAYLDTIPTYLTIDKPQAANVSNITAHSAHFAWPPLKGVDGYSLRLNKVEVYRGIDANASIGGLEANVTYFVTVAGVAGWGTDGENGPKSNFTTKSPDDDVVFVDAPDSIAPNATTSVQ